jgi:predicted nuclease of predicted toxin-antitoxin system
MRFLCDMPVSQSVAESLREQGHDAFHARERSLQRSSDRELLLIAASEERVVLTFDLDFGRMLAQTGANRPSVIQFRTSRADSPFVLARLNALLAQLTVDLTRGAIVTVDDDGVRVRSLPVGARLQAGSDLGGGSR